MLPTAERPNRRPDSWQFARPARVCAPANFGIRQGRGAISGTRVVPKSCRLLQPDRCQESCRFLQPEWCQKSCRFLQPEWCQKSCRFDGRGTAQWPSEVGRIYAARSLPKTLQISEAQSSPKIPTRNCHVSFSLSHEIWETSIKIHGEAPGTT